MPNSIPSLEAVRSLNGSDFAMLTADQARVLDFYRAQGRKFDVTVAIVTEADPTEIAAAASPKQADCIMKRSTSVVSVTIGPGAESAWRARSL